MGAIIVEGEVRHGRRLGGKLGFPTANIAAGGMEDIAGGVYAARAAVDGRMYEGMASLGYRPTIDPDSRERVLEVHLFGFEGSLYGRRLSVELAKFIRPEERFGSLDELKEAVEGDRREIEEYFKTNR